MSSTSSERNSTSASNRSHNQGRQDREYTPAQQAAVNRVRKCKPTDYYGILDLESPSSDSEIRKAYRKLALIMHPDKNTAPGADEAFKMVSKAFQVLSDPDKKRIYDQTGADPESRGAGFASATRGGGGGMNGGMPYQGADISPEDLFNMFFGGGLGGGLGGGNFQTQFGGFGGPNIRVHTFGGGSPFTAFTTNNNHRRQQQEDVEPFSLRHLVQLLPLLLLFGLPFLTSLFGDSSSSSINQTANFKFNSQQPYTTERRTPVHDIAYFVNPKDIESYSDRRLYQLDRKAEVSYISLIKNRCYNEYEHKQQKIADSRGWFFVDTEAYEEAINIPLESCEILDKLGVVYTH